MAAGAAVRELVGAARALGIRAHRLFLLCSRWKRSRPTLAWPSAQFSWYPRHAASSCASVASGSNCVHVASQAALSIWRLREGATLRRG